MLVKDKLDHRGTSAVTVDPKEIERFAALAQEWWKPDGKFGPVHAFNAVRQAYIMDSLCRHFVRDETSQDALAGLRILDVGCGAGLLCEPLARRGAHVVGIDATSRNVDIARDHAAKGGLSIDYRHALADSLLQAGESFDAVLNTEVIEHVADQPQLMSDCCHLVRPDGTMIVATLNRTLRAFAKAIVGAEYVLRWLPKGTHDWRRFVKPDEISAMIAPHGFRAADVTGVSFNPVSNVWRLSKDASVNYMLAAERRRA